jgi:hypothetical protein
MADQICGIARARHGHQNHIVVFIIAIIVTFLISLVVVVLRVSMILIENDNISVPHVFVVALTWKWVLLVVIILLLFFYMS